MNIFSFLTIVTCFGSKIINAEAWKPLEYCGDELAIDNTVKQVAEAQRCFATNFYQVFMKETPDMTSFVTCPFATWIGLSKIYFGSRGKTRQELHDALDMKVGCLEAQIGYQDIAYRVKTLTSEVSNLRLSNDLYYDGYLNLEYHFKKVMDTSFSSGLHHFYFNDYNSSEEFKKTMEATYGSQLNVAVEVNKNDSMVLVDTGSFSVEWMSTDEDCLYGSKGFFYSAKGHIMQEFVHNVADSIYGETRVGGVQVSYVGVPLQDTTRNAYLLVILPDETDEFPILEQNINESIIKSMILDGKVTKVHAAMPIMNISSSFDISDKLKEMAYQSAFENADLNGIARHQPVRLNRVLHNTHLQLRKRCGVSECPSEYMVHFNGDHAFIVAVVTTTEHPIVLMIGRYTGP